jgi:hypothetical protein
LASSSRAPIEAVPAKSNPAYAAAISGLRSRGGVVPRRHFDIASGSPIRQKGQISSDVVLQRLLSVKLVSTTEIDGVGECVMLGADATFGNPVLASMRARLLTESVLIDAIRMWAGRMNMASPNASSIRDDDPAPQFATFHFDICGPCYLRPLVRTADGKVTPGFLVADVIVGDALDKDHVAPFLRKCVMLGQLKKVRPFLPMLIADGFTPEALRACRSRGIIATRTDTLFGQDVARALTDLFQTLSNAAAIAVANPDRIDNLFKRLSAIEGSAGNLRGALFELLVGHMVQSVEGGSIDIGVIVRDNKTGQRAEVDVRLVKQRAVTIYECKGHQPSSIVRKEEIEKWLTKRVPTINNAHHQEQRFDSDSLRFEFWTCGSFEDDAIALLEETKTRTRKYQIAWKDGAGVRDYVKGIKASGIRKIFNEHYFEHALAGLPDAGIASPPPIDRKTTKTCQDELADLDDFEDLEADDFESAR